MSTVISPGTLYIVATPIGNLGDISQRATETLRNVDLIAAEDTRHSRTLLDCYGITTPMQAFHEHNERQQAPVLVTKLKQGVSIALISDAGTPLVNDPGYRLVQQAHTENIPVVPVPGACAAIAALSAAGLATDRFIYEGFTPSKQGARRRYFESLINEPRTMVFYVSCHKIGDTLEDMAAVFGPERPVTMARELTKSHETIIKTTLSQLEQQVQNDANQSRGEIVLVMAGNDNACDRFMSVPDVLPVLLDELPLKQAAKLAAKITGQNKNILYKRALQLKQDEDTK